MPTASSPSPALPPPPRTAGLVDYLKHAFLFRWNLLFFGGGVAAAALMPMTGALLPLIAAGELTYLAGLVSQKRFRAAIDARVHAQNAVSPASARAKSEPMAPRRLRNCFVAPRHCRESRLMAPAGQMGEGAGMRAEPVSGTT